MNKDENLNPMGDLYSQFKMLIGNMVIKYQVNVEDNETLESKQNGDKYLDAYFKQDSFFTYRDYSNKEFFDVGLINMDIINKSRREGINIIPRKYREALLENRRKIILSTYDEQNDYYRLLEGYPPLDENPLFFHYVPKETAESYGIDVEVPIHQIQDYYNNINSHEGDRLIAILEGNGYIDNLIALYPEDEYLNYLGSKRIPIHVSRRAKNFEILRLFKSNVKTIVYDEFVLRYGQARDYFVSTLYNREFRSIIGYYDNFIAMCITIMAINQVVMRQLSNLVNRNFYDIQALRMLYEAYDVPYDLYIDEETQSGIVKNLNLLIQNKSTNKVLYDIANLLGYSNMDIYKYYLMKERKYDQYGLPIVKYIERFNNDTGEIEVVPDYEKMYDIYFQKAELREDDFVQTFNNKANKMEYNYVTKGDPYWIEDENLHKMLWETSYNFVETKYLGFGVSFKMTQILYENVVLLKLLLNNRDAIDGVTLTIPKIVENTQVPLFDTIILMLCLVSKKHYLMGEIISIPTQVISVLDYLQNTDEGNTDYLVNTFSFNFDYLLSDEGIDAVNRLKKLLGPEKSIEFDKYLSVLKIDSNASADQKMATINAMYENIKGFANFLNYEMLDASDRKIYEGLKRLYEASFYSKEVKSIFTIVGETTGFKRTAKNFFEYLNYRNPKLYNAIFSYDVDEQYQSYLKENDLDPRDFTIEEYQKMIEEGILDGEFDILKDSTGTDNSAFEELLYYYINHIISRLKTLIPNLNFISLLNDTATPLENLLVKLVNFFKSFTVDIVDLDVTYVCNMKPENLIRLIDEIHCMIKVIAPNEYNKISYSDVIHNISSTINIASKNLKFKEVMEMYARIDINDRSNFIGLLDKVTGVSNKTIENTDTISQYDVYSSTAADIKVPDSLKMKDKPCKIFYTD